jgi:hypothetical protein
MTELSQVLGFGESLMSIKGRDTVGELQRVENCALCTATLNSLELENFGVDTAAQQR